MDGLTLIASASGVNDSGQTVATSSALNIAAGDLLVCWASWWYGGGTQSVTDGGANAFTLKDIGGSEPYGRWGLISSASANASATFTFDAGEWTAFLRVVVLQYRPVAGYTITDHAGPSPANGSGSTGASGAIATTVPAIVLGSLAMTDNNTISNLQIDAVDADGSIVYERGAVWYRDVVTPDASIAASDSHQYTTDWMSDILAIGVEAVGGGIAIPVVIQHLRNQGNL